MKISDLFKPKQHVQWWEIGVIKFSLLCMGIAIGSYWADFFAPYALLLAIVGLILGVYSIVIWYKK